MDDVDRFQANLEHLERFYLINLGVIPIGVEGKDLRYQGTGRYLPIRAEFNLVFIL